MYKDFVKTVRGIRNSAGCKTYDALFHQTTRGRWERENRTGFLNGDEDQLHPRFSCSHLKYCTIFCSSV